LIARQLDISLHTVKFHVESVFRKLEVGTRAAAVAKALEANHFKMIKL
jgi:DNA-binding CsgD family transcriptional regulator